MNKNCVAGLLNEKGYETELVEISKNGIIKSGIVVKSDTNLNPTFYFDKFADMQDIEVAERIEDMVNNMETPLFDTHILSEKEYILRNVIPSVQRQTNENIAKMNFCDLEIYFRVLISSSDSNTASYKVSKDLMNFADISLKELFCAALRNVRPHFQVCGLGEMLASKIGLDMPMELEIDIPLYVAYTDYGMYGASTIIDTDLLSSIAEKIGAKRLAIIPSSIHELLIMELKNDSEIEELDKMVTEVNFAEVSEEERLSDHIYVYDSMTQEIKY